MTDATTTIEERRKAEFAKYHKAYQNPNYHMGKPRAIGWQYWAYEQLCLHGYKSVLDVACGRGEALDIARALGYMDVQGCEVIDYLCQRNDVMQIEGIHKLPIADDRYDIVSCQDAFEHILEEDVVPGIRELCRVAKHKVFLSVAWFECQLGKSMDLDLHITVHELDWWNARIEEAIPEGASWGPANIRVKQYDQTATLVIVL